MANMFGGDDIEIIKSTPESRGDFLEQETTDERSDGSDTDINSDGSDLADGQRDSQDGHTEEAHDTETGHAEEGEERTGDDDSDEDPAETGEEAAGEEDNGGEPDNGKPDDKAKKKVKGQVPRHRLNQEISKRQAAERRIQELEQQNQQRQAAPAEQNQQPGEAEPSADDFAKLQEAMLDENTEQAFEIFKKFLNKGEQPAQQLDRETIKDEIRQEMEHSRQIEALNAKSQELSKAFPELDSESDELDAGLLEEVVDLRNYYIQKGLSFADALDKSARSVALTNGLKDRTAKQETMSAPPKRKVDMQERQKMAEKERGKLGGSSKPKEPSKKLSVLDMSEDDFKNLSKEEMRKLRGDYLV